MTTFNFSTPIYIKTHKYTLRDFCFFFLLSPLSSSIFLSFYSTTGKINKQTQKAFVVAVVVGINWGGNKRFELKSEHILK